MYEEVVLYVALGIFVVITIFFIIHVMFTIRTRRKFSIDNLSPEEMKELKKYCRRKSRKKS